MAQKVLVLVGTTKGAFILESDAARRDWRQRGPYCEGWPINHVVADPENGAIYAGGGHPFIGQDVWRSDDEGVNWTHAGEGLAFPEGAEPLQQVWSLAVHRGRVYAGSKPAGLFASDDRGRTWRHLDGLQRHPTRSEWHGGGAGLVLHSLVVDPADPRNIWVGISSAGVFHSADGGASWEPRNRGTRADYMPEDQRFPEFGQCVHCLVKAPDGGQRLYQQNHCGMYRSDDGGARWESIEAGLPSSFGFAAAAHPRDPDSLFLMPLNSDRARTVPDGRAAVWRTRDGGATWDARREGLPQKNVFFGVLRQAMATDGLDRAGVYVGTNTGMLYASADEGDSFAPIAEHLPTILSVETVVLDA
ncbi:MAG TPA: sialidase family protein [Hyphomicrobiales bacterium]|nr:sialidase family protein [Hyphomicrobiales bacterium]